jgi:hypothetical protein
MSRTFDLVARLKWSKLGGIIKINVSNINTLLLIIMTQTCTCIETSSGQKCSFVQRIKLCQVIVTFIKCLNVKKGQNCRKYPSLIVEHNFVEASNTAEHLLEVRTKVLETLEPNTLILFQVCVACPTDRRIDRLTDENHNCICF